MTGRRLVGLLVGAGLLTFALLGGAAVASASNSVTLCHAKGPDAKNGWNAITISPDSAQDPVKGHDGHANDIIPAFDFGGGVAFAGQNLGTDFDGSTGQEVLDNGCLLAGQTPEITEPATDTPTEPNTAELGATGTSGPADGAWLLVVALGVLLASIVVLTPARAKSRR